MQEPTQEMIDQVFSEFREYLEGNEPLRTVPDNSEIIESAKNGVILF